MSPIYLWRCQKSRFKPLLDRSPDGLTNNFLCGILDFYTPSPSPQPLIVHFYASMLFKLDELRMSLSEESKLVSVDLP